MKYNTTVKKDINKTVIKELLNINRYILKMFYNSIKFDFNTYYAVYEIKNGFTTAELEKALKIELDSSYNYFYIFKQEYTWSNEKQVRYYTSFDFTTIYNNKKEWIQYPNNISCVSRYYMTFDDCRKYPKIITDSMCNIENQTSYIIIQPRNNEKIIERNKKREFNFNIDRFKPVKNSDRSYLCITKNNKEYYNCDIESQEKSTQGCKPGYYYNINHYTKPDKSGYFNKHISELKKQAIENKKNKLFNDFKTTKKELYSKILFNDFKDINNFIFKLFSKAGNSCNIDCVEIATELYLKLKGIKADLKRYVHKLENNDFSNGYYNSNIIDFEKNIIELDNKCRIDYLMDQCNDYYNFKKLYKHIESNLKYNEMDDFLKNNIGYKWTCCSNCYDEKKHIIKDGKMWLSNYYVEYKNYFNFMQV